MDTPDTPNRIRRYRLKLYPTKEQADRLHGLRLICGDLQNACIERYREVYASEHRTLRRYELSKWITARRAACPVWRAFPAMTRISSIAVFNWPIKQCFAASALAKHGASQRSNPRL
jgi:hypothetical protein